ncbi:MAG: AI-2E family transporter, partial [Halobacteriales archaeon]|nr:AI-2E family transporter [Halobacteriales archaeon]
FVAPLTVAVFLYYSTRRYYKSLGRFPLPRRVRGVVVLGSLAIPLLLLISYTAVLLVIETRRFVTQYQVLDVVAENVGWLGGSSGSPSSP